MPEIPHLLVHDHKDSVGVVVVEGLAANTDMLVGVTHDNSTFRLKSGEAVPIGHKIALKDIAKGDTVFKYGEDIGVVTADVKKGGLITIEEKALGNLEKIGRTSQFIDILEPAEAPAKVCILWTARLRRLNVCR